MWRDNCERRELCGERPMRRENYVEREPCGERTVRKIMQEGLWRKKSGDGIDA